MQKSAQRKLSQAKNPPKKKDLTVEEVETIFLEKFQEKFSLTRKDIKRAFSFHDHDGSGFLDPEELTGAISHYVNGVSKEKVAELVKFYDIDGNGNISLEEFTHFLLSRTSPNKDEWMTVKSLKENFRGGAITPTDDGYDARSVVSRGSRGGRDLGTASEIRRPLHPDDINAVEYATKIYMGSVRAAMLAKARVVWRERRVPSHKLKNKTGDVIDEIARDLFIRAFNKQPSAPASGSRSGSGSDHYGHGGLDIRRFREIVVSFKPAGSPDPDMSVVQMLYSACKSSGPLTTVHSRDIDPQRLCNAIFDNGSQVVNKFGFGQMLKPSTDTGRAEVGKGPIVAEHVTERTIEDIPHRYLTPHCRTSMAVPSDFSVEMVRRSNNIPSWQPLRDHCFGLNANLYSGQSLHGLPSSGGNKIIYCSAKLAIVHDLPTNTQAFFEGHTDDVTCVALSPDGTLCATGQVSRRPVVLVWRTDLNSNTSEGSGYGVFKGPGSGTRTGTRTGTGTDERRCVDESGDTPGLVQRIGEGFFQRGIDAVQFSYDNKFLVAIGCDDHHTLGVFLVSTGELCCDATTANGSPPQIYSLAWSPGQQSTEYITRDHDGECDVFVTAGFRHLKFWSFRRASKVLLTDRDKSKGQYSLTGRAGRLGSGVGSGSAKAKAGKKEGDAKGYGAGVAAKEAEVGLPKINLSTAFVSKPYSVGGVSTYDVLVGGDNGNIYLYRNGVCNKIVSVIPVPKSAPALPGQAFEGGVRCLITKGNFLYIGGGRGQVSILALSDLSELARYSVMPSPSALKAQQGKGSVPAREEHPLHPAKPSSRQPTPHRPLSGLRYPTTSFPYNPLSAPGDTRGGPEFSPGGEFLLSSKRKTKGPPDQWGGEKDPTMVRPILPEGISGSFDVTGIALVDAGRGGGPYGGVASIVVSTAFGKAFRIDVGKQCSRTPQPAGKASIAPTTNPTHETLFTYHYGPVRALSTHSGGIAGDCILTGGDDRWLCLWDLRENALLTRARMQAPVRCCHFTSTGGFVAAGTAGGIIGVFVLDKERAKSEAFVIDPHSAPTFTLTMLSSRKDCNKDISDIKFNSAGTMLAVGSHEDAIDLYSVECVEKNIYHQIDPAVRITPLKRLIGHRSFITHLDWSNDGHVLRSTCGAYEILMWDIATCKAILSSGRSTESDIKWASLSSPLGFGVMGVWKKNADGTDINAVDVSFKKHLVVTADDFGDANLLNYPCVVANAPSRALAGHSSHVMNARFAGATHDFIVTVGGNDCAAMVWLITRRI